MLGRVEALGGLLRGGNRTLFPGLGPIAAWGPGAQAWVSPPPQGSLGPSLRGRWEGRRLPIPTSGPERQEGRKPPRQP